jgi:hypothetical protein
LDNPPTQDNADDFASRVGIRESQIRCARLLAATKAELAANAAKYGARAQPDAGFVDRQRATAGKTAHANSNVIGRNVPDRRSCRQ